MPCIFINYKSKSNAYPDFDWWTVCNAQPVTVWWEAKSVDAVCVVQGVQMFAVIKIPEQSFGVFTTGCAQWTVWRNGDGVQVSVVTFVVDLEFAVGQIPYFDGTIPTAWHDDWVGVVWWETDTWNPVRVTFILDGVFAFSQSVPQFNGLVTWSRHDLTIVSTEGNWQNILLSEVIEVNLVTWQKTNNKFNLNFIQLNKIKILKNVTKTSWIERKKTPFGNYC